MTPRELLVSMMRNDERNIRDCKRDPWLAHDARLRVIADCAQRMLHARGHGHDLELRAEENLREALEGWRA